MPITATTWSTSIGGATLSGGDLTAAIGGGPYAVSDYTAASGKYYFELTFAPGEALGEIIIGVSNSAGAEASIHGVDLVGGRCYEGDTSAWNGAAPPFTPIALASGSTVGIYVDVDAETIGAVTTAGDHGVVMTGFAGVSTPLRIAFLDDPYQYTAPITTTANFGATAFSFTPPTGYNAGFGSGGAAEDTLVLPSLITSAYTGAAADIPLPMVFFAAGVEQRLIATLPRLAVASTVSVYGAISAAIPLPSFSAESYGGANSSLAIPPMVAQTTAHDSTGEQAIVVSLPGLTLDATTGASSRTNIPSLTAAATGTVTQLISADLGLPSMSASGAATTTELASAALSLPLLNLTGTSGAVCSITLGGITTQATGVTGTAGRAAVTLPLFVVEASATQEDVTSADITLPSLSVSTGARAPLSLPSLSLVAVGTAIVTATYEAYALNLSHQPRRGREEPIDEMTRYTNFPFTHVVRYKNSYYGANGTGLYLLEGATDDGADISWAVKTGHTDFDSAQLKTVEMAYFGGRLGPDTTITLYPGEVTTTPYAHTTPRGAAAQNYRQPFGRGQRYRYYALGMSGEDAMAIDSITLNVATLARKV